MACARQGSGAPRTFVIAAQAAKAFDIPGTALAQHADDGHYRTPVSGPSTRNRAARALAEIELAVR